ncbi:hypothetical protein BG006_001111 [Podila minutissima]|uniref:P-loop containing nucleoside triphosphate hydrolase protein n=1 Tax=Podila minutissima TaxID=64525 RepID=A0A9P5VHF2_9FUNG|nr:hypothetical protein BG006_001111 [Podila minutissima]
MTFCDAEGWAVTSAKRAMDFTPCFQESVLSLIPSVALLIVIVPRLHSVIGKGQLEGLRAGLLYRIKVAVVLGALAIQIALLVKFVALQNYTGSSILSTVLYIVSLLGAIALHHYEYFNMPNPSTMLLLYWLGTALISIFLTRTRIQETPKGLNDPIPLLKLLFTIFSALAFILENIPKAHRKSLHRPGATPVVQANPSPEPSSNFFSRMTFFWLLPLLNLGKKKTLRMDDIWNLHPKLLSYPLYLTSKAKVESDELLALQKATDDNKTNPNNLPFRKGRVDLTATVMYTVGWSFLLAVIPRVLFIAAYYVRPILYSNLISFITSYDKTSIALGNEPQVVWIGWGLMLAVLASGLLSAIFDAQFQNYCFNSSLKARGVIVTLIYRKSLRLSSTNKQEGMGSIVNHMSTDVDKVVAFFRVIHYFWSCIIELIITIALLYAEIKYAMFASLGVIILILIYTAIVSPKIGMWQKKFMKSSDVRIKLITELVNNIKSIKLYAWETFFAERISSTRIEQLNHLRKFYCWVISVSALLNTITPLSTFVALSVYSAIATAEEPLDIRRIFTTITLINMLQEPVYLANDALQAAVNGKIRDGTFGWYTPEAIQTAIEKKEKEAQKAALQEAKDAKKNKKSGKGRSDSNLTLEVPEKIAEKEPESNNSDEPEITRDSAGPVLHDLNLKIKRGSLTAVVGRVGEGKSSLVGALLGEMHKYSGSVHCNGSLAFVAQTAWILNDTVRNNILFGLPYDKEKYLRTIKACALAPDFKMLVNSDKTLIGEKGINLSGGQKQRISIARAVYADADVYIFDDPLSAVDAHVDKHLFEHAVSKVLANKTRILVTNGVSHLKDVDQIVVVKAGRISQDGVYDDLIMDEKGDLYRLIQESKVVAPKRKSEKENDTTSSAAEDTSDDEASLDADIAVKADDTPQRPAFKRGISTKGKLDEDELAIEDSNEIDEEIVGEGRVGWDVYKFYFATSGALGSISFVAIAFTYVGIEIGIQLWLKFWGDSNSKQLANVETNARSTQYWIFSYMAWILSATLILTFAMIYSINFMARRASKKLHISALGPMIRSPMSFFDVTSSGKIINRFSHDISEIDINLPLTLLNGIFIIFMMMAMFGLCIAASPYFAIMIPPLSYVYYRMGGFYLVTSRELKRLDSSARSPLYAHYTETLAGLVTIRAFHSSDRFAVEATKMLDHSQQTGYLANAATRWLQVVLEMISVIILTVVSALAIAQRSSPTSGIFAIVLSQIGGLTSTMNRFLNTICLLETSIVSVERIKEYSELKSEARDVIPDSKTDEAWPQQGMIQFSNYSTRYRDGLDLVLKDLDLIISAGERVGIVGRTGAGKSSITLALFRIVEAAAGTIAIDGIDISTLGLQELRSRLTIIPQDPFLFGATIRLNLDPFGRHTDAEIWAALESASLKSYISSLSEGLSTTIENGGENMSLGQRQLMSLARAMLTKNTRVLCLDEATAAIDIETDNAIQRALRREFSNCTVLTIAHRINTIMDSDRILVLDHGRVAEYDTPQALLQKQDGLFHSLAVESGNH